MVALGYLISREAYQLCASGE